jgi:hypothetical protein
MSELVAHAPRPSGLLAALRCRMKRVTVVGTAVARRRRREPPHHSGRRDSRVRGHARIRSMHAVPCVRRLYRLRRLRWLRWLRRLRWLRWTWGRRRTTREVSEWAPFAEVAPRRRSVFMT